MRRSRTWVAAAVVAVVAVGTTAAAVAATMGGSGRAPRPIIVGAAVDLSGIMRPFDSAALRAAQIRAAQVKVNGQADPDHGLQHAAERRTGRAACAQEPGRPGRDRAPRHL